MAPGAFEEVAHELVRITFFVRHAQLIGSDGLERRGIPGPSVQAHARRRPS